MLLQSIVDEDPLVLRGLKFFIIVSICIFPIILFIILPLNIWKYICGYVFTGFSSEFHELDVGLL